MGRWVYERRWVEDVPSDDEPVYCLIAQRGGEVCECCRISWPDSATKRVPCTEISPGGTSSEPDSLAASELPEGSDTATAVSPRAGEGSVAPAADADVDNSVIDAPPHIPSNGGAKPAKDCASDEQLSSLDTSDLACARNGDQGRASEEHGRAPAIPSGESAAAEAGLPSEAALAVAAAANRARTQEPEPAVPVKYTAEEPAEAEAPMAAANHATHEVRAEASTIEGAGDSTAAETIASCTLQPAPAVASSAATEADVSGARMTPAAPRAPTQFASQVVAAEAESAGAFDRAASARPAAEAAEVVPATENATHQTAKANKNLAAGDAVAAGKLDAAPQPTSIPVESELAPDRPTADAGATDAMTNPPTTTAPAADNPPLGPSIAVKSMADEATRIEPTTAVEEGRKAAATAANGETEADTASISARAPEADMQPAGVAPVADAAARAGSPILSPRPSEAANKVAAALAGTESSAANVAALRTPSAAFPPVKASVPAHAAHRGDALDTTPATAPIESAPVGSASKAVVPLLAEGSGSLTSGRGAGLASERAHLTGAQGDAPSATAGAENTLAPNGAGAAGGASTVPHAGHPASSGQHAHTGSAKSVAPAAPSHDSIAAGNAPMASGRPPLDPVAATTGAASDANTAEELDALAVAVGMSGPTMIPSSSTQPHQPQPAQPRERSSPRAAALSSCTSHPAGHTAGKSDSPAPSEPVSARKGTAATTFPPPHNTHEAAGAGTVGGAPENATDQADACKLSGTAAEAHSPKAGAGADATMEVVNSLHGAAPTDDGHAWAPPTTVADAGVATNAGHTRAATTNVGHAGANSTSEGQAPAAPGNERHSRNRPTSTDDTAAAPTGVEHTSADPAAHASHSSDRPVSPKQLPPLMARPRAPRKPHHDIDTSSGLKGSFEGEGWEWDEGENEVARRAGALRITLVCESRPVAIILCLADEPITSLKHRHGIPPFMQLAKGSRSGSLLNEGESLTANGVGDGDVVYGLIARPPTASELHRMAAVETLSQLDDEAVVCNAEDAEVAAANLEPLLASVGQDLAQSYSSKLEKWMGPRFAFKQPEGPEFATKHLAWMTNKPFPWQLAGIGDAARQLVSRGDAASADRFLASSGDGYEAGQDSLSGTGAIGRGDGRARTAVGQQRVNMISKEALSVPSTAHAAARRWDGDDGPSSTDHHYVAVGWSSAAPQGSGKLPHRLKPISGASGARTPRLHSRSPSPAFEGRMQRSHMSPSTVLSATPGSSPQRESAVAHNVYRPVATPKATKARPGAHLARG